MHPHSYDAHYIEAVWATDQHGAVVAFEVLADKVTTAASPAFQVPMGITITPFEYCKTHFLSCVLSSPKYRFAGCGKHVCRKLNLNSFLL